MTIKERVQGRLKPKVKQFGFTRKVFRSVAAKIADKLGDIDEDASEDDINAKIDDAIEDSMPYLALIQSSANEMHDEWKKGLQKDESDDNVDDESAEDGGESKQYRRNRQIKSDKNADSQSKEMKQLLEAVTMLTNEVKTLKGEKVADTRRAKLERLLKDSGAFGKRTIKNFGKMNFKDDEDFEEWYNDVEDDLKAYNQERADAGLSTAGDPPGGKGGKQESKIEEISDADIDAIVANL